MQTLYASWQEHLATRGKPGSEPAVMPWLFSRRFRREHPEKVVEIKARMAAGYLSRDSGAFQRQLYANVTFDNRDRNRNITAPTLILVRKDDELTPPSLAEELKSQIRNSELLVLDQGGHGPYWEIPELFNKAVMDFLLRSA